MDLDACGKDDPAVAPDIGMEHERQPTPTNTLKESFESTMVIGVTVGEHNTHSLEH
jgi:hypothetical protein